MQRKAILTNEIVKATKSFIARTIYHAAQKEYINHRNEIISILERAALDETFRTALLFSGTKALEQYELNWAEKAALISGDISFIEKEIGVLTPVQKCWLIHRLQAEVW